MEHEERELDKLDEHSDEVGEDIDDARREWEAKQDDPTVPGAQPSPDEDEDAMSGQRGSDESPGVPGEEDTGTGNPDAAGADEEDSSDA